MTNNRRVLFQLLSAILFHWSVPSIAQIQLSGQVTDSLGIPLVGANLFISSIPDSLILSFTSSDESGHFALKVGSRMDSIEIHCTYLGFKEYSKAVSNRDQQLSIILEQSTIALNDFVIGASSGILDLGDTIEYDVSQFTKENDQTLGEVMSRLPGIEVSENGKISYNGKSILKYYIEGLDLLEGRYNLANQTLRPSLIENIQVLENHQPIMLLDSLYKPEEASINITLKNPVALTAQVSVGGGVYPLLYDERITPMLFNSQMQFLGDYQINNTGNLINSLRQNLTLKELINETGLGYEQKYWLQIPLSNPYNISSDRWAKNQSQNLTPNFLTKLKNGSQLKLSSSFFRSHHRLNTVSSSTYFLPDDTLSISETKSKTIHEEQLETKMVLEKNSSSKYARHEISISKNSEIHEGVYSLGNNRTSQGLPREKITAGFNSNQFFQIGNQFLSSKTELSHEQQLEEFSIVGISNLTIDKSTTRDSITQYLNGVLNKLDQSLGLVKKIGTSSIRTSIGINQINHTLGSNQTYGFALDSSVKNDLHYNRTTLYNLLEAKWEWAGMEIIAQNRVKQLFFKIDNTETNFELAKNPLVLEPILNVRYTSWKRSEVFASWSIHNSFTPIDFIYENPIILNYRTFRANTPSLFQNQSQDYFLAWNFQEFSRSVFITSSYNFNFSKFGQRLANSISENGIQTIEQIADDNIRKTHLFLFNISKYFPNLNSTIKSGINYSASISNPIVNDLVVDARYESLSTSLFLDALITLNMNLTVSYQNHLKRSTLTGSANELISTNQITSVLSLFLPKKQTLTLTSNHFLTNYLQSKSTNHFYDLSYRFKAKKTLSFTLLWRNILNNNEFIDLRINEFYYSSRAYELRNSQLICSFLFRI